MDIQNAVKAICDRESFQRPLTDLLVRICEIDTTPAQDLEHLREGERQVFQLIREALDGLELASASIAWRELSPAIQHHPAYSRPYYAVGPAEEVYRGRGNLLYLLDREPAPNGRGVALNAHIDTVAPFFPPSRTDDFLCGRGAADDKGNVIVLLGALQVLDELERRGLVSLKNKLTVMFVIDEETGGNGSLDLALDRSLKERYDSILVMECTGNRLHPANRGAVFIRCAGRLAAEHSPSFRAGQPTARPNEEPPAKQSPSLAEAFAFAILELLDEGDAIRLESDHPLFPHRPVQTCTGILGPFGVHPSAICAEVSFELTGPGLPDETTLRRWIDRAIHRYVARYGDKTQLIDPATGVKKVERHHDLDWRDEGRWGVTIHGASGHMGSLPQNDAAITKWAYVVREIVEARRSLGVAFSLELPSCDPRSELIFEGAQGFLPTHPMEEIKARARAAFLRGLEVYLAGEGLPPSSIACDVTFDKLHNEAYACDPASPTMRRALESALEAGLGESSIPSNEAAVWQTPPPVSLRAGRPTARPCKQPPAKQSPAGEFIESGLIHSAPHFEAPSEAASVTGAAKQPGLLLRGWEVSCDARLFATEHPGMPVITFGAGKLEHAHSNLERVHLSELFQAVCFATLFVLRESGTVL